MTLLSTQMHVTWTYIHDMKPFARRPWYIVLRKQADQPQEHHHLTWSETQKHEYSRMNETLNDYGHASSYMRTMPLISCQDIHELSHGKVPSRQRLLHASRVYTHDKIITT